MIKARETVLFKGFPKTSPSMDAIKALNRLSLYDLLHERFDARRRQSIESADGDHKIFLLHSEGESWISAADKDEFLRYIRRRFILALSSTYRDCFDAQGIDAATMQKLSSATEHALDHAKDDLCDWEYLMPTLTKLSSIKLQKETTR